MWFLTCNIVLLMFLFKNQIYFWIIILISFIILCLVSGWIRLNIHKLFHSQIITIISKWLVIALFVNSFLILNLFGIILSFIDTFTKTIWIFIYSMRNVLIPFSTIVTLLVSIIIIFSSFIAYLWVCSFLNWAINTFLFQRLHLLL